MKNSLTRRMKRFQGRITTYARYLLLSSGIKIPKWFVVHHIDLDPTNDLVSNLSPISRREQARIHNGWVKVGVVWFRMCPKCEQWKNEDQFYKHNKTKGILTQCRRSHLCIQCDRERLLKYTRQRRLKSYGS